MKYKHLGILVIILLDISFYFVMDTKDKDLMLFGLLCFASLILTLLYGIISLCLFFSENWNKKIFDK